jgi:hypothetical protein
MAPSANLPSSVLPLCRCCLQPVYHFYQPNFFDADGKHYVHCESPSCPLYYATREISDWLMMDLDQWNAVQHPNWKQPEPLLEVA